LVLLDASINVRPMRIAKAMFGLSIAAVDTSVSEARIGLALFRVCITIAQTTVIVATRQSVAVLTNVSTRVVRDVSQIQIVI
jgi:hypothetical protein